MIMCPMPRTILIVDDDPHIRQLLVFALDKAGLGAVEAADGETALALVAARSPDMVVLDINMPRMDGLETCRRLRAESGIPILFLSSRDDEIDRVLGIELGADDYVVKPFSPREVVARIMAILRRTAAHPPALDQNRDLAHGRLRLDLEGWRALWDVTPVSLTVTEFQLLRLLVSVPTKVFSRDAIIDRLHGPGLAVTDRTIDSHIRNLRYQVEEPTSTTEHHTRVRILINVGCLVVLVVGAPATAQINDNDGTVISVKSGGPVKVVTLKRWACNLADTEFEMSGYIDQFVADQFDAIDRIDKVLKDFSIKMTPQIGGNPSLVYSADPVLGRLSDLLDLTFTWQYHVLKLNLVGRLPMRVAFNLISHGNSIAVGTCALQNEAFRPLA